MPRAGLTPTAVVDAAADIADEVGLSALTLAAVAKRCGVALPSLYKHVGGLDDVQRRIAIAATRELAEALRDAAVGRAGDDALVALGRAYRAYARQSPGRYAATVRAPTAGDVDHLNAAAAAVAVVVAVLGGYGITGDEAVHCTRALRSALHGFVALEASGGFGLPQDIDSSFELMLATFTTAFAR